MAQRICTIQISIVSRVVVPDSDEGIAREMAWRDQLERRYREAFEGIANALSSNGSGGSVEVKAYLSDQQ